VGLIVAEIGLGLRYLALIHILGHASLRTLQFLRASSILQDYRTLENAIGARLPEGPQLAARLLPGRVGIWLYRLAVERGYLDAWLASFIARPLIGVFRRCDSLERQWTDFLSGSRSRQSDQVRPSAGSLEDLS
jgi:NAD(P)H-quinone oxidoreductase subunit 5